MLAHGPHVQYHARPWKHRAGCLSPMRLFTLCSVEAWPVKDET